MLRRLWMTGAALLIGAATAQACIVVETPFGCFRIGCRTKATAPLVMVPATRMQPSITPLPGQPELIHAPRAADGSPSAAPRVALSHPDFARSFTPAAGNYEVDLIHPYSRCPVHVCFTLPPGCPRKVRVERGELEFDYGRTEVEIRFKRDGRVQVQYRD